MKKLLGLLALLPALAFGQVNTYNILTTTSAITQGFLDNSTLVATDAFVKQTLLASTGTLPIANVTGGTYNFAPTGTGALLVTVTLGGSIQSIPAVANGGSGYQVGDCLIMVAGNGDAIARVTAVSGGAVTAASVLYGGTGYSGSPQAAGIALPPGSRFGIVSGTLTSNLTIIIPGGTYLQGSRRIIFANNTTGAFTTTVYLTNGSDGTTGSGLVLPQGSNNSTAMEVYTDGVTDVWSAVNAFPTGVTCSGSPTASFATHNGIVTHC